MSVTTHVLRGYGFTFPVEAAVLTVPLLLPDWVVPQAARRVDAKAIASRCRFIKRVLVSDAEADPQPVV